MAEIRAYRAADEAALYDVCLRTGDDGADASALYRDPRLLGSVYVGPYLAFEPQLAFVLDGGEGAQGYVLGALDSGAFGRTCEEHWWPGLRERYAHAGFPAGSPDAQVVALLHDPPGPELALLDDYPSHLHIDLLPRWQGAGWGRRLIETLLSAMARAGSPGVQLGVASANEHAIGFYRRMGFVELARSSGGMTVGLRLDRTMAE